MILVLLSGFYPRQKWPAREHSIGCTSCVEEVKVQQMHRKPGVRFVRILFPLESEHVLV